MGRTAWMLVLAFGLLAMPAFCGEADGKGKQEEREGRRGPPLGMIGKFILDHAKDLGLTDEQKTKIEEALKAAKDAPPPPKPEEKGEAKDGKHGKGPFSDILTEEQKTKLKDLLKAERPPRGHQEK